MNHTYYFTCYIRNISFLICFSKTREHKSSTWDNIYHEHFVAKTLTIEKLFSENNYHKFMVTYEMNTNLHKENENRDNVEKWVRGHIVKIEYIFQLYVFSGIFYNITN